MRTSSNCFSRKKQEAIHCRPGIVSIHMMNKNVVTMVTDRTQLLSYQPTDNIVELV